MELVKQAGAELEGMGFIIEKPFSMEVTNFVSKVFMWSLWRLLRALTIAKLKSDKSIYRTSINLQPAC